MIRRLKKMLPSGRYLGLMLLAFVCLFAVPTEANPNMKVKKNAFQFSGVRYFRNKAENVRLGTYGDKKTPLTQGNYLADQGHITPANLSKVNVGISGPYSIDWGKYSRTEVEAGGKTMYVDAAGAKAELTHSVAKSANLKLVKFHLAEGALKRLLNQHANGARTYLAKEGNSGRVVSEVWVVMDGKLASEVTTGGSVSASAAAGGIKIDIKIGSSTTTTKSVTLPPNTTFAYLMHKVKKWNKGKTKVEDLEDDQHGPF